MDCFIKTSTDGTRRLVSISGRLTANEVGDLLGACAHAQGQTLAIDLSELMSIDAPAKYQLARLQSEGAELIAVPPYIELLLSSRAT